MSFEAHGLNQLTMSPRAPRNCWLGKARQRVSACCRRVRRRSPTLDLHFPAIRIARSPGGPSSLRASYFLILAIGTVLATAPPTSAEEERPGFAYGAIVHTLDDAHFAREAGFTVISAYVAWAAVEPTRGDYIFEQTDRWGRTQPNDLTNVLQAARANGLRVGLRLDAPPDWAGGAVYRLNPADVENYVYHVVRYA